MTLLLVGSNHRTAPIALRERLYVSSERLQQVLKQLRHHSTTISEVIMLSTCNRFEVYAASEQPALAQQDIVDYLCEHFTITEAELMPTLYIQEDEAVTSHLMAVAAGLDSMVLGEAQIIGQVSGALENASLARTSGARLHRLFEAAIHAGKRARTETSISQHTTSISHAAGLLMVEKVLKPDPHVLILGAGDMAELAVYAIHKYGLSHISLVNRTFQHAQDLATKFGVQAYPWSQLWQLMRSADVVITATGAPHTLLHIEDMRGVIAERHEPLIIIDIAIPRDVAPVVGTLDGVELYDIDALQHIVDSSLASRQACVPQVRIIITEEAERYHDWLRERAVVPLICDLRQEVATVIETELQQAINKLPNISENELAIVRRMAHRIMNKVLHAPTVTLRSRATDEDAEHYANMVRELFDIEGSGYA
ncbi:MAG: glutamyl-tRNA reductase [Anaerolineae bacterium]